ncbi:uncharacterized protein RBU57_000236 [Macrochelys suwanniensis]
MAFHQSHGAPSRASQSAHSESRTLETVGSYARWKEDTTCNLSPPHLLVPPQGPFSRATPNSGGANAPHYRGNRGGSKGVQGQGVLLSLFPDPQIKRGATSYPGLARTQQIYGKVEVLHGFPGYYYPFLGSWRLVRCPRHEGLIFPYRNLPTTQTFPPLCCRPKTLSIRCPSLRPIHGTKGVHEVHGRCGSRSSSTADSSVPLPRQLAYPQQLQQPSPVAGSDGHEHVQPDRPAPECRKVHFGANPKIRLHRGSTGLDSRLSVFARGTLPGPRNHHTWRTELPNLDSSKLPQPARSHGILHIHDRTRQITPQPCLEWTIVSISPTQRQHGHGIEGAIAGPSLPRLVAGSQEGAGRGAIPCARALPGPDHRCVIPQLGDPPERSSDTGPVVGSGISPPHQHQGAAGSAPCLPSLFQAPLRSLCRSPHGQHNGHVLY